MRAKELSVERQDRIVSRHRSGEGYQNISAALQVPKNTVDSINLKWKKFGTPKTFLELAAQPNSAIIEKGLGQGGDQEPNGHSDRAPECLCGDGRTFQKDNHFCSTPPISTNQPLRSGFQKAHASLLGVCQNALKVLSDHEKQDSLV